MALLARRCYSGSFRSPLCIGIARLIGVLFTSVLLQGRVLRAVCPPRVAVHVRRLARLLFAYELERSVADLQLLPHSFLPCLSASVSRMRASLPSSATRRPSSRPSSRQRSSCALGKPAPALSSPTDTPPVVASGSFPQWPVWMVCQGSQLCPLELVLLLAGVRFHRAVAAQLRP